MNCNLADQAYPSVRGRHLIYIVCQAAWREGIVYGIWIEALQSLEEMLAEIDRFLDKSPARGRGVLIKDYQGFYSLKIKPDEDLAEVQAKALFVAWYGPLGVKLVHYYGGDFKSARDALEHHYRGQYESGATQVVLNEWSNAPRLVFKPVLNLSRRFW